MSYARWTENSDVYVYLDVDGYLRCCGCGLGDVEKFYSTDAMIQHLRDHRDAEHDVPESCFEGLTADREDNERFIAEKKEANDAAL